MALPCFCDACVAYTTTRRCTCHGPCPCVVCKAYKRHPSAQERLPVILAPQPRTHASRYDPVACLITSRQVLAETEDLIVNLLVERTALPPQTNTHPWTVRLNHLRRNAKRLREAIAMWEGKVQQLAPEERTQTPCHSPSR